MEKNQKKAKLLTAGGIGLAVLVLIIILLLKPAGLLGKQVQEKV